MEAIARRLESVLKVRGSVFRYHISESRVFALRYHSSGIIFRSLKMASCEPKHVDVCVVAIKSCVRQLCISNFACKTKWNEPYYVNTKI